jgi:hypothetical protein
MHAILGNIKFLEDYLMLHIIYSVHICHLFFVLFSMVMLLQYYDEVVGFNEVVSCSL